MVAPPSRQSKAIHLNRGVRRMLIKRGLRRMLTSVNASNSQQPEQPDHHPTPTTRPSRRFATEPCEPCADTPARQRARFRPLARQRSTLATDDCGARLSKAASCQPMKRRPRIARETDFSKPLMAATAPRADVLGDGCAAPQRQLRLQLARRGSGGTRPKQWAPNRCGDAAVSCKARKGGNDGRFRDSQQRTNLSCLVRTKRLRRYRRERRHAHRRLRRIRPQ